MLQNSGRCQLKLKVKTVQKTCPLMSAHECTALATLSDVWAINGSGGENKVWGGEGFCLFICNMVCGDYSPLRPNPPHQREIPWERPGASLSYQIFLPVTQQERGYKGIEEVRAAGLEPSDPGSHPDFATHKLYPPGKLFPIPEPIRLDSQQVRRAARTKSKQEPWHTPVRQSPRQLFRIRYYFSKHKAGDQ